MKRRGMSLVETIVVTAVLGVLMTGLLSVFTSINGIFTFTATMPVAQDQVQRMIQDTAAAIRKATLATSADTSCVLNSAVESASSSALTVYSGSNGALTKTRFDNSGSNVTKQINGASASTWYANATLTFTYYRSSTYHGSTLVTYTPDAASVSQLVAVQIAGTVTTGSETATYTTLVRLRNGPLKTSPGD